MSLKLDDLPWLLEVIAAHNNYTVIGSAPNVLIKPGWGFIRSKQLWSSKGSFFAIGSSSICFPGNNHRFSPYQVGEHETQGKGDQVYHIR
jgi:hypothetical protein